jgi:methionyl-tRNA formyltransferase
MKYVYAGDRQIAVNILRYLLEQGYQPQALLLNDEDKASHNDALKELVAPLGIPVFVGNEFRSVKAIEFYYNDRPDYFLGIHFPKLIPAEILNIPKVGFLNLHPAYLPYNKGWHTPSWAILEGTPYGATLHFMSEELDAGDIIHQKELKIRPEDTAHSLYQKVLVLEEEVFREALPSLLTLKPMRKPQREAGTAHRQKDLETMRELKLNEPVKTGLLIDRLRALTTSRWEEAAWFEKDGKKYLIRVEIREA